MKSNCPLNLITGCANLGSKNCDNWQWVFCVTVEGFWPTHLCRIVLIQQHWRGFRHGRKPLQCVKGHATASQSDLSPDFGLQNLQFVFGFWAIQSGLPGVFWIIVLLTKPNVLEFPEHRWWPKSLRQHFLVESRVAQKSFRSWSWKATTDIHTTATAFYFLYDLLFMKCCVILTPDIKWLNLSRKFSFCPVSPQNICSKVLGAIRMFYGICEMSLCVLFGQQRTIYLILKLD